MATIVWIRHAEKAYANGKGPKGSTLYDPDIVSAEESRIATTSRDLIEKYGPPQEILSSPYLRTRRTADILAQTASVELKLPSLPIRIDKNIGEYLGYQKLKTYPPGSRELEFATAAHVSAETKETEAQLFSRVEGHIEILIGAQKPISPTKTPPAIWIVTHGLIISCVFRCVSRLLGKEAKHIKVNTLEGVVFSLQTSKSNIPSLSEYRLGEVFDIEKLSLNRVGMQVLSFKEHPIDEVSSALQKSIRRGIQYDAVYWGIEMYLTGQAVRTNAWNRLLVVSMEDIGLASPASFVVVAKLFFAHQHNSAAFATACVLLARERKSRAIDWGCHVHSKFGPSQAEELGSPDQLVKILVYNLKNRSLDESLLLAQALRVHPGVLPIRVERTNKAQMGIWLAFRELVGKAEPSASSSSPSKDNNQRAARRYLDIMERVSHLPTWRWNEKSVLLHTTFIHMWCLCPETFETAFMEYPPQEILTPLLEAIVKGEHSPLSIPDYALDRHTSRGRSMKRDLEHFFAVGAKLIDEDPRWKELSDRHFAVGFPDAVKKR